MQIIGADLCEEHAAEMEARLCQGHGCPTLAELVIGIDGRDSETGAPRQDELRICEPCWDAMQSEAVVTINGIRMVHDGSGRMKALPRSIGRG